MSSLSMILCFFLISYLALFSPSPAAGDNKPSVYVVLEEYNLPKGLLPEGASGYELDRDNGKFKVWGDWTCEYHVSSTGLKSVYNSTISGVISKNELNDWKGVRLYKDESVTISKVVRERNVLTIYMVSGDFPAPFLWDMPVFEFSKSLPCGGNAYVCILRVRNPDATNLDSTN